MVQGRFSAPQFSAALAPIEVQINLSGSFEEIEDGFVAHHILILSGVPKAEADLAVRIQAEYALTYGSSTPMTPALFMPFKQLNLPVQTWPYFREFVQTALARLEWPKVTLPTLHSGNARLVEFSDAIFEQDMSDQGVQDIT